MKRRMFCSTARLGLAFLLAGGLLQAATPFNPGNPQLPALFIAGDSTAAPGNGWAVPFPAHFDLKRINVHNRAVGGTSSRTFITGGKWDALLTNLKAGDFVLIQFGHNDTSPVNETESVPPAARRSRGSLPGIGEESREIDNIITGKHEVIHTYGWYLRKMIKEVQEKGATPIVLSLTVHNTWKDGKIVPGRFDDYRKWSEAVAKQAGVTFIDVNRRLTEEFNRQGEEAVKRFFPKDAVHTNLEGANLIASIVAAGIRDLKDQPLKAFLSKGASP